MTSDEPSLPREIKGLSRVIALSATKGMLQKEQIEFLNRAGFSYEEIAQMVDTSIQTVTQTLYALRKARTGHQSRKRVKKSGGE